MGIGNVGRAFLLGTSALVMTSAAAVSADFDITEDTVANKTLGPAAGETGTVQSGITLSPGTSGPTVEILGSNTTLTNEGTIAGGGLFTQEVVKISGAIDGVTIINKGAISGPSIYGGMTVNAGADVTGGLTNDAGATISGKSAGIDINNGGDISGGIDNGGTILGDRAAGILVRFSELSGDLVNSGTVRGVRALSVEASGDVTGKVLNQADGLIQGVGRHGISVDRNAKISGGVENFGRVTGSDGAIFVRDGSDIGGFGVINRTGGVIAADFGIDLNGTKIVSPEGGADISGGVTNEENATLSGNSTGIRLSSDADITGGIDNSGLIKGEDNAGLHVSGESTLTGRLTNQGTGTISGGGAGIGVSSGADISAMVDNSGLIKSGTFYGVLVEAGVEPPPDAVSDISGGILNRAGGTISGFQVGIRVEGGSRISGGIDNSGLVLGEKRAGIGIWSSDMMGAVVNRAGGTIATHEKDGFSALGVFNGANISGGIDNDGTISGRNNGIAIGTGSDISGGVDNSGGISGGFRGLILAAGGDISGSGLHNRATGTISSRFTGILVRSASNISGGVENAGTIKGMFGIVVGDVRPPPGGGGGGGVALSLAPPSDISGGLINQASGTISGGQTGIWFRNNASITGGVNNAGTVKGGIFGIVVGEEAPPPPDEGPALSLDPTSDISGGVINTGTISGGSAGLFVHATSRISGGIDNGGVIEGVRNFGTISHKNGAIVVHGPGADITDPLTNQVGATVSGGSFGIHVKDTADISGGVDNGGVLSGGSLGLLVAGNANISGAANPAGIGVLNRAGATIDGNEQAIRVSDRADISGGVDNSGLIRGETGSGINVRTNSDLSGGVVNQAGGTLSGLQKGIFVNQTSDLSGGVDNSGLIKGDKKMGIGVFHNSDISGGVVNQVGATISGLKNGIVVHKTSDLSGGVDNSGRITGGGTGLVVFGGSNISGTAGPTGLGVLNQVGAMIDGDSYAIRIRDDGSDISGGVDNRGTVSGGTTGIRLFISSDLSGGVVNTGLIKGGTSRGIGVYTNSDLSGGVVNQVGGTISGLKSGILVHKTSDLSGGVVNQVGATISGLKNGILVHKASDLSGGVDNSGRITGGDMGLAVFGGSNISGVLNQVGAMIDGATGIRLRSGSDISGGVVNRGTIEGTSGPAIHDGGKPLFVINGGSLIGGGGTALNFRGGDDRLMLKTGSTLVGGAKGGAGKDALMLRGTGTEDDAFRGFETLAMKGVDWGLSGAVTLLDSVGSGRATVNEGRLRVNGTLSAPGGVKVKPAGTLGGTGVVAGMVTNQGTLAPGNSVGTLRVTGDVAFAAGSTLAIEVDGSEVDLLDVDGDVTVDPAAVLEMTFAPGAVDVQGAVVTQATGSIDAAFATVNTNDKLVSVDLVGGKRLELDVVGVASVNAAVAASAEEGFSFQNAVAGAQLSPRAAGSATPLWVRGVSEVAPAEGGTQQAVSGVLFGGDVASFSGGALRLGVAGGYVSSDAQALVGDNSAAAEGLQAGTYGTYDLSLLGGETQLTFGLHGGYQTQETERAVVVGGTRTVGRGETQGSLMGGYLGASREFALGEHLTLRPGARLGYLHQELEGYRDSAGLQVGALSADSLRFGPQVELSGDYRTAGGITFKPRGQVGWSQQVALDDRAVRLTLPSGAGGKVALDDGNAGSLNVAFGLDMVFEPGTSAYLSFDGTYGSDQTRTSAFAGISFDLW